MQQNLNKWACQACTYLNWPRSLKCVQCQTIRFKDNREQNQNNKITIPPVNRKIESGGNTAESRSGSTSPNGTIMQQNNNNLNKWPCPACTYLNWPRSLKCVQCQTVRNIGGKNNVSNEQKLNRNAESRSGSTSRNGSNRNSPPPISTGAGGLRLSSQSPTSTAVPPSVEKSQSPSSDLITSSLSGTKSPSSPDANVQGPSTVLDSIIIAKKLQKWTCTACTYENWPKTVKCVMCTTSKPGSSPGRRVRTPQSPSSPPTSAETTSGCGTSDSNDKKRSLR